MFDFLGAIGGFFDFLGSVAAFLEQILAFIFQVLVTVATYILQVLEAVFGFFANIISKVGQFFAHIWNGFFKGIFTRIFRAVVTAQQWLEARLRPILNFLKRVRAIYDRIFKAYIKPVLNLIQHVRQVLLVLRLLHVKFAQELDQKLAAIQNDITKLFIQVRGYLNFAIDFINIIASPSRLSRFVLAGVIGSRATAALFRLVTGANIGFFFPNYHPNAKPWEKPVTRASSLKDAAVNPSASSLLKPLLDADTYSYTPETPFPDDGSIDGLEPTFTFSVTVQEYADNEVAMDAIARSPLDIDAAITSNSGLVDLAGRVGLALVNQILPSEA